MNAGHLQQVLMNLIVNARSAMLSSRVAGAGAGKRLTIRAGMKNAIDGGQKRVEISLADTGPGIPADVLPRIFEPFFSTKRGRDFHEGTGGRREEAIVSHVVARV